jgi:ZIP family zinc transporter
MALWLQALLWGLLGGSALLIGSAIGYSLRVPGKLVAGIMAFGAGVLISALSFELMEEAYGRGGFAATAIGFLVIPEAFESAHNLTGFITVLGFLAAFALSALGS